MSKLNELGHNTIHRLNDFTHQVFGNVCDVIDHIIPQSNLSDQEENTIRRYIQCDINYEDNSMKILAYIPGVKKEDINVSVESNVLTIDAISNHSDNNFTYVKNKHYYRTFNLPKNTETENITIYYSEGILKIIIINNYRIRENNTTKLTVN